jgi:prephenate dehydrogenase
VSVSKPRITIVGLGLVGGSLGMALRQAEAAAKVLGHDRNRLVSNEAKSKGAVDQVHWNLISACEKADLVILALPLDAIPGTMEAIGPHLQPGCVVIDTASVKQPVMDWAAQHLPPEVHFVGTDPVPSRIPEGVSGIVAARADLFEGGIFCVVPSSTAASEAIALVSDLAALVGGQPLFVDAAEHDGLRAGVEQLPALLALALLESVVQQPTWQELRKMAGSPFEAGTRLQGTQPTGEVQGWLANRENLLRWVDGLLATLSSLRQAVDEGQAEDLVERFQNAWQERQSWASDRQTGDWREGPDAEMPPRPSLMESFLGGLWPRRRTKRE